MNLFDFREPVSAWTHLGWMILSLPATVLLWRRCKGAIVKQLSFLFYGICLALCFGGSAFYHGVCFSHQVVEGICQNLDYIGIFLMIAGNITPLAVIVLRGKWRWMCLTLTWSFAGTGIMLRVCNVDVARGVSNCLYLGMGWGIVLCYFELSRRLSQRGLLLVVAGGLTYSAGAVMNWQHWPALWPGVFSAHELMHLFVMAASLIHFVFMWQVVARYRPVTILRRLSQPARGLQLREA
jgi:hemolysin III